MIFIYGTLALLLGARRIPKLARGPGNGINEFKDATKNGREWIADDLKGIEMRITAVIRTR